MSLFVGTSGWNYDSWRESLYGDVPRKRWLSHYADRFGAVELDGTFYRLPSDKTLHSWKQDTPKDFCFAAKGHRFMTHSKKLKDADEHLPISRDAMRPLGKRLRVVLWQLPASFKKNEERLDGFLKSLSRWRSVRHALELRDRSWFDDDTAGRLEEHDVAVCLSDAPDFPLWDRVTTDLVYVRLHGHTRKYASRYSRQSLEHWRDRVREWRSGGCEVHVYFDNDKEGHAPTDALKLKEMV